MTIGTITPQGLRELLSRQPELPLIDVRMPAEYREVHLAGARNVRFDRLSKELLCGGEDRPEATYFICKAGKRSLQACQKAAKLGLPEVINVDGGTEACIEAGLPVQRGERAFALERQVRIAAGSLIVVGSVLAVTLNPYWALLPTFVGAGLVYSGISDTCGMGALLTKMPWNR